MVLLLLGVAAGGKSDSSDALSWRLPIGVAREKLLAVTPTQLRTYAAVVRHGSARRAAEELGVSEAAVSAHTSALRRELDDPLYRRAANGLSFTPGGLRLATRAVELLGLQDLTRQEVVAASQGRRVLRLAATSLFAEFAAPGLIELFGTRADDLDVELSVHPSSRFQELLLSRVADVAIGPRPGPPLDGARNKEFLKYQLVVVVGAVHRLAGRRCRPADLAGEVWALGPSAVEAGGATDALLSRFSVPERNQRIFQSQAAAIAEAEAGRGIAIVPEFRVRDALADSRLVRVSTPGAAAPGIWTASSLRTTQASAVASELVRFITTPRAIQAMLTGSGADVGRFRPSVHVTLWS